jgi:predicted kinase
MATQPHPPTPAGASPPPRAIVLVTGIQAAGKSTVAQLLSERLPRAVHLRGDLFRRLIVSGRADMTPDPSPEALAQLDLRYRLTATTADAYFAAGFSVVAQDVILGPALPAMVARIRSRPLLVVVLAPSPAAVRARESARPKTAYRPGSFTPESLDEGLRETTPPLGLWLDTSAQTPAETVDEILSRAWTEAAV